MHLISPAWAALYEAGWLPDQGLPFRCLYSILGPLCVGHDGNVQLVRRVEVISRERVQGNANSLRARRSNTSSPCEGYGLVRVFLLVLAIGLPPFAILKRYFAQGRCDRVG